MKLIISVNESLYRRCELINESDGTEGINESDSVNESV